MHDQPEFYPKVYWTAITVTDLCGCVGDAVQYLQEIYAEVECSPLPDIPHEACFDEQFPSPARVCIRVQKLKDEPALLSWALTNIVPPDADYYMKLADETLRHATIRYKERNQA